MDKKIKILGFIILLILFGYSQYKSESNKNKIKKNYILVEASIFDTYFTKGMKLKYRYNYNNIIYSDMKGIANYSDRKIKSFLLNRQYPVIVSINEPNINELLLFKKDFEKYNLTYPDSLKWVCDSLGLKD